VEYFTPGEEPAHCINGKNTTDDDIPERDITDCTNPNYMVEHWQTAGRAEARWKIFFVGYCSLFFARLFTCRADDFHARIPNREQFAAVSARRVVVGLSLMVVNMMAAWWHAW